MKQNLTIDFANFLNGLDWGCYCTFTTPYSLSLNSARGAMERLYNILKQQNLKPKMFWVAEPFDTKYGYHTHALLKIECDPNLNQIELIKKAWFEATNNTNFKSRQKRTIIVPYKKGLAYQKEKGTGAHFYVAKYINRKEVTWDIYL